MLVSIGRFILTFILEKILGGVMNYFAEKFRKEKRASDENEAKQKLDDAVKNEASLADRIKANEEYQNSGN